jgi:hypothetical protein
VESAVETWHSSFCFERRDKMNKCDEDEKKKKAKQQGCLGIAFDFVMTICTGGLWLIWVLIRYLRSHQYS